MIDIKPFRAVQFNSGKVSDLARVVCPPYDVISPQQQNNYYNQSEFNFIRVLLSKDKPGDNETENRYTRARDTFADWLGRDVLVQNEKPAIYYYLQDYKVLGEKHSRLGFISLMKIQEDKSGKIYPHENTHARAKEDRLKLWQMLSSNLSPIFVCYSDRQKKAAHIFARDVSPREPVMDVTDTEGVRHRLWALEDPESIREIAESLRHQQLFIADGHHRYEVARELRRRMNPKGQKSKNGRAFNYLMTYFTNMDSRDLKIFPIHRVIRKIPRDIGFLKDSFRIDRLKTKEELSILLAKAGKNEHAFGLYQKNDVLLLRLKNRLLIDKVIKGGSPAFRHLDATILKHFVLDPMGIVSEDIIYIKDLQEASVLVDEDKAQAAFIMNPVRIQQLREIALNGERMPPKTTYFYPKVLSGLTIYKITE